MTADSVLARARVAAEALMVDSCTIVRRTIANTNPETGRVTYSDTQLYAGKCRARRRTFFNRPHEAAEDFVLMLAVEIWAPMSLVGVTAEDIVTMTASVHDPDLVGRIFSVKGMAHKTHGDSRRFQCIEVNS